MSTYCPNNPQLIFPFLQKRQIYREQVVPHAGGKIPDSAFDTDRLLLNRLQKDGFAVPDGVILEQRNPQVLQVQLKSITISNCDMNYS